MTNDLLRETGRKTFHMLSLAYLAAYWLIGWPRVLPWLFAWFCVVTLVETARLLRPALNDRLHGMFKGLSRPEEYADYSGIFHTTGGALLLIAGFGADARVVSASIYCVAFGDAAAALIGKAVGGPKIFGKKSWAGSLACLFVCLAAGRLCGFGWGSAAAGAIAATAIELCPTTRWFNDNLWMPLATAVVYWLAR